MRRSALALTPGPRVTPPAGPVAIDRVAIDHADADLAAFQARQRRIEARLDAIEPWLLRAQIAIAATAFLIAAPAILAAGRALLPG